MLVSLALLGCATGSSDDNTAKTLYATVPEQSQRNTERARELNAEAVQAVEAGEWERAEQLAREGLTADLMYGPAHNTLGRVYYHQKQYYLAAWEFDYAIKLMPNQSEPRNNLGLVYEATGQYAEAVDWYERALALEPERAELMGNLARSRLRRGDKGKEMRELLTQLVVRETRPDWSAWARQQLELLGGPPTMPSGVILDEAGPMP